MTRSESRTTFFLQKVFGKGNVIVEGGSTPLDIHILKSAINGTQLRDIRGMNIQQHFRESMKGPEWQHYLADIDLRLLKQFVTKAA